MSRDTTRFEADRRTIDLLFDMLDQTSRDPRHAGYIEQKHRERAFPARKVPGVDFNPGSFVGTEGAAPAIALQIEYLQASFSRTRVLIGACDADQRCTHMNQAILDYTGLSLEEALRDWSRAIHPDDLSHLMRTFDRAFAVRAPFLLFYRLRRADGGYGWISSQTVPYFAPDGTFAGYIGFGIEVAGTLKVATRKVFTH